MRGAAALATDDSAGPRTVALPAPLPPPEIDPGALDLDALKVVARLRRHGYAAYLVGGCVRDLLVHAQPKDYDVATSAHPEQIRGVFRNSRLIGRRFRLAHVFFPGGRFVEVATFRASPVQATDVEAGVEGEGEDLLVTDDNQFGTAEEDARRRDFTVNGLFYDVVDGKVIDYVGGREDLDRGCIRTIGDPEIRMREDPVRGLRAARIAAKLKFRIDEETFDAMVRHAGELPRCAPARVLDETLKLLRSGSSKEAFATLRRAGILAYLIPPVDEAIEQGGDDGEAAFLRRLGALDEMLAEGVEVSDAVMLASLLSFLPMPALPGRPDVSDEESDDEEDETELALPTVDLVLARMSEQARLPRRTADRVGSILRAQRLFLPAPKKRKRRRSGGFVRAPHFPDAFQLFDLVSRATGEHRELIAVWQQKIRDSKAVPPPPVHVAPPVPKVEAVVPGDPVAVAAAAPTGPKRKRRRGGRGRKKKAGVAAPPPESAPT